MWFNPEHGDTCRFVCIGQLSIIPVDQDHFKRGQLPFLEDIQHKHFGPAPIQAADKESDFHTLYAEEPSATQFKESPRKFHEKHHETPGRQ